MFTPLNSKLTHPPELHVIFFNKDSYIFRLLLADVTAAMYLFSETWYIPDVALAFATFWADCPETSFALMLPVDDWELNEADLTIFLYPSLYLRLALGEQWLHKWYIIKWIYKDNTVDKRGHCLIEKKNQPVTML